MYWFTCSIKCYTDIFTKFKCYKWLRKYALCTRQWLFSHRFYFLCSSALRSCWSMRSVGNLTSQQWSRLVLLEGFRASGGTWSCPVLQAGQDGPAGSQSGKDERQEGWNHPQLSQCLPSTQRRAGRQRANRQFESSDACRASSLPALPRFQPGVTSRSASGCKRRVQHKMAVLIRDIWVRRGGAGSDPARTSTPPRLI